MQKLIAIALMAFVCATPGFVAASEILNVAVPDSGAWDSFYTEFGLQQGFFKEEPANVNYLLAGEIRIIARANDSPQVRNETTRVNAVNANFLASHRGAVIGFLKAYKKSVDWAFSSQLALDAYAKLSER